MRRDHLASWLRDRIAIVDSTGFDLFLYIFFIYLCHQPVPEMIEFTCKFQLFPVFPSL